MPWNPGRERGRPPKRIHGGRGRCPRGDGPGDQVAPPGQNEGNEENKDLPLNLDNLNQNPVQVRLL